MGLLAQKQLPGGDGHLPMQAACAKPSSSGQSNFRKPTASANKIMKGLKAKGVEIQLVRAKYY